MWWNTYQNLSKIISGTWKATKSRYKFNSLINEGKKLPLNNSMFFIVEIRANKKASSLVKRGRHKFTK